MDTKKGLRYVISKLEHRNRQLTQENANQMNRNTCRQTWFKQLTTTVERQQVTIEKLQEENKMLLQDFEVAKQSLMIVKETLKKSEEEKLLSTKAFMEEIKRHNDSPDCLLGKA